MLTSTTKQEAQGRTGTDVPRRQNNHADGQAPAARQSSTAEAGKICRLGLEGSLTAGGNR